MRMWLCEYITDNCYGKEKNKSKDLEIGQCLMLWFGYHLSSKAVTLKARPIYGEMMEALRNEVVGCSLAGI